MSLPAPALSWLRMLGAQGPPPPESQPVLGRLPAPAQLASPLTRAGLCRPSPGGEPKVSEATDSSNREVAEGRTGVCPGQQTADHSHSRPGRLSPVPGPPSHHALLSHPFPRLSSHSPPGRPPEVLQGPKTPLRPPKQHTCPKPDSSCFSNLSFLIVSCLQGGPCNLSGRRGLHHTFLLPCIPSNLTHTQRHTADYCSQKGLGIRPSPPARGPRLSLRRQLLPVIFRILPHSSPAAQKFFFSRGTWLA